MAMRGDAMHDLRLSILPLAILTLLAGAASQHAHAQQAAQPAVRLVVFEDFMRPT
jgi:hypothetical protein